MIKFELTTDKKRMLKTSGHILVLGGPGSGKSTTALIKAGHCINSNILKPHQHVLFLSFARSTVARVAELAGIINSHLEQKKLIIETYHGFAWNLIRSHGYLINNKRIKLLLPHDAASRLAEIKNKEERNAEKIRIFEDEGLLHFDLFAKKSFELLSKSKSLAKIFCDAYPLIILDEFQDTNRDEWLMIQELGKMSCLMALADLEQRIYDFRGADPKRISEFIAKFSPTQFDFGLENNRSGNTDIVAFGNDLLTGTNLTKKYNNVELVKYQIYRGNAMHKELKISVIKLSNELRKSGTNNWSLAILVPTKQLMLDVSDYLDTKQMFESGHQLPTISHEVAFETSGPSLAAVLIASLLECKYSQTEMTKSLISNLCSHIRGRNGDENISKANIELTGALNNYVTSGVIRGSNRKKIVDECEKIIQKRFTTELTGDPGEDWLSVRNYLLESTSKEIRTVAEDAKYLRFLHKGATLRLRLSEIWRKNGNYFGAIEIVQDALSQEHFSSANKEKKGIQVMTIHKSKGKEFDQVIIYEDAHQGRILHDSASEEGINRSRLMLRVGVTRAKKNTKIFSPNNNLCPLLFSN